MYAFLVVFRTFSPIYAYVFPCLPIIPLSLRNGGFDTVCPPSASAGGKWPLCPPAPPPMPLAVLAVVACLSIRPSVCQSHSNGWRFHIGNDMRQAHGCYGTLIGGARSIRFSFRGLWATLKDGIRRIQIFWRISVYVRSYCLTNKQLNSSW